MAEVTVCIPTVSQRATALVRTVAQWRALGIEPLVVVQDAHRPLCHESHYHTATQALRDGIDTGAPALLLSEDDVDLSPALAGRLPGLVATLHADGGPLTLYAAGTRFYPTTLRDDLRRGKEVLPGVYPLRQRAVWYGSQAILLSRALAIRVAAHTPLGYGWDRHLANYTRRYRLPFGVVVPNLVQHREVRSVVSSYGQNRRSVTYAG